MMKAYRATARLSMMQVKDAGSGGPTPGNGGRIRSAGPRAAKANELI